MARLSSETFSTATQGHAERLQLATASARVGLITGLALAACLGIALMVAFAGPVQQAPELARLLHAMVMIKGLILAAAVAAIVWRLGRPAATPIVLGYTVTLGTSTAALGWLWGLSLIPLGSALFYGGLLGAFITATRDRHFFDGILPRSRS